MEIKITNKQTMTYNKGNGKGIKWLLAHIDYNGRGCLTWPFSTANGYGNLGYMGEVLYAHRVMCQLVHGNAPSPQHEVAHSCGRGHLRCIDPRHVSWKTKSENMLDSTQHGTHRRNPYGQRGKLKPSEVRRIRALRGKLTQQEIGDMFGVSDSTIRDIYRGHTHQNHS